MPGVLEAQFSVEEEEVWRAGGVVVVGGGLMAVNEVGEGPAVRLCKGGHLCWGVCGITAGVVGVDGDHSDIEGITFLGKGGEGVCEMHDIRAVIAHEHDEEPAWTAQIIQSEDFS